MKNLMRKLLGIVLVLAVVLGSNVTIQTYAAGNTTKCYTIKTGNTVVYSNTGLTKKYGTIYDSDEITVINITTSYTKVSYPTSNGTKTGYIKTSSILSATGGKTYTARAKIAAYRRPGGSSYGNVSAGDVVVALGTKGDYLQIRYPVSGGYKFAWVSKTDANNYIYSETYAKPSNGKYTLVSAMSDSKVVDINGGYTDDGTNIQLWEKNGTSAQTFTLKSVGNGWYTIRNTSSTKSIDVAGGKAASGVNVQLYKYNGTDAQLWSFYNAGDGYYYIKNKLGYYLTVNGSSTNNGSNIMVSTRTYGDNQRWKLSTDTTSSTTGKTALSYGLYKNTRAYISCGFDGYKTTSGRHEGIDIVCSYGAPIYSLTSGTVVRVTKGYNGSGGLSTIAIYNAATNKTVVYLHSAPASLKVGQSVKVGDKIGTQAWRGISSLSGSHTHVEVRSGMKLSAAKSVGDSKLDNSNPTSFWNSMGYTIK